MIQSQLYSNVKKECGNDISARLLIQYVAGSNKGSTAVGDIFNSPFALRNADSTYTSSAVQENATVGADKKVALKWGPVIPGAVTGVITISEGNTVQFYDDGAGKIYSGTPAARRVVTETASVADTVEGAVIGPEDGQEGRAARVEVTLGDGSQIGTITYGLAADKQALSNQGIGAIYDEATPEITFTADTYNGKGITTNYNYNNTVIPQNDLPILTAKMVGITLQAKARRIAVEKYAA